MSGRSGKDLEYKVMLIAEQRRKKIEFVRKKKKDCLKKQSDRQKEEHFKEVQ